jgi:hypothetical protein
MERRKPKSQQVKDREDAIILLSEEEQDIHILKLRTDVSKQINSTRKCFALIYYLIAALLFFTFVYSLRYPWELQHERHFKNIIPISVFYLFYVVSLFCIISASVLIDHNHFVRISKAAVSHCARISALLSLLNVVFWLAIYWIYAVSNPILYWLPLIDVSVLTLAFYVDRDCMSLANSVTELEKLKYSCKCA